MNARAREEALFEHAPPVGLQSRFGLVTRDSPNIRRRALLAALLAWAPLVLLAIVQSAVARLDVITPLLTEVAVHARYLIAVPLLVLAEEVCAPHLNAIIHRFTASGIVGEHERNRLDEAIASTRRLLKSNTAELLVPLLAYLVAFGAIASQSLDQLPAWASPVSGMPRLSLAGWWHMLVSLPLLLVLILGWLWRLTLWARLLWRVSRLDLRLVASHPDHCAGLSFVGHSLRAFAIVALALSTIAAGRSAHLVMDGGGLPTPYIFFNVGLLVVLAAIVAAPVLVFMAPLMRTWRHGSFAYGTLADRAGQAFEHRWLDRREADKGAFERPDFSATADLYAVVSNVAAIRFIPIDLKDLIALVGAMLLPFVPVVLIAFPLETIWTHIKSLLL